MWHKAESTATVHILSLTVLRLTAQVRVPDWICKLDFVSFRLYCFLWASIHLPEINKPQMYTAEMNAPHKSIIPSHTNASIIPSTCVLHLTLCAAAWHHITLLKETLSTHTDADTEAVSSSTKLLSFVLGLSTERKLIQDQKKFHILFDCTNICF